MFLVIRNHTAEDSFLFEKTNISYGGMSEQESPQVRSKVGERMALLGPGLIAMGLITNATALQQNLLKKEIQSKTLSPGTTVSGFLYVPVSREIPRRKIRLQVPLIKSGSSETFVLNLSF